MGIIVLHKRDASCTRDDRFKEFHKPYLCNLLWLVRLIYLIWKPCISSFKCHMVAWSVPMGCRVTDQNVEGDCQTPGRPQNMVIKYLSVGQMSRFLYQQIALDVLFQMRYGSLHNSNKEQSVSLKAEATPVFTSKQDCFAYCFAQWCSPGVCRHPSSFWSVTLQPLGADQSTIPHMKGDIHSFHGKYISMIFL